MPADIINKHWPTFILCGRPAGRNGCTSLNSGKVIVDAEAATADNPTGTFRAGASLEVMESEGRMSRAARQSGAKVAAAITAARNRAVNRGEDPDEAEKDIRQKLSNKKVPNTDGDTTTPKKVQIIMKRASPVQLARSAKLNATLKRKLEQLEHKESKRNKLLTQGLDLHDPKIYALDDEIKGIEIFIDKCHEELDHIDVEDCFTTRDDTGPSPTNRTPRTPAVIPRSSTGARSSSSNARS